MNSKPSFIQELVHYISNHRRHGEKVTLILPNKRAGLFFRKAYQEAGLAAGWFPEVITLSEFVASFSQRVLADPIVLNLKLFHSYLQVAKKKAGPNSSPEPLPQSGGKDVALAGNELENFEDFFFWGEMLLKDFDELDKYLVKADQVFRAVKSQRELDEQFAYLSAEQQRVLKQFWNTFMPETKGHQGRFLAFWKVLSDLYRHFNTQLEAAGLCNEGYFYKNLVEQISQKGEALAFNKEKQASSQGQTIFAGFNALTPAEETIIRHWVKEYEALVYWDADPWLLQNPRVEGGKFFRAYQKDPLLSKFFADQASFSFMDEAPDMELIGASSGVAQARILGEKIAQICQNKMFQPERTAIILADESLLLPVLYALPKEVQDLNITMGYPLKGNPVISFLYRFIALFENYCQGQFALKNIEAFLKHPLAGPACGAETQVLIDEVQSLRNLFVSPDRLKEVAGFYEELFQPFPAREENALKACLNFLEWLQKGLLKQKDKESIGMELEASLQLARHLRNLDSLLQEEKGLGLRSFEKLLQRMVQSIQLPFSGEPLKGIQIMGSLESRNLDFDHIFFLSFNEGIFPPRPKNQSFVPFNIRKAFALPLNDFQVGIYSYLFFRLLRRAKSCTMLYTSVHDEQQSGEPSRFFLQLKYQTKLPIQQIQYENKLRVLAPEGISISKKRIWEELINSFIKGEKEFSASMLNTYKNCSLQFYFAHFLNLKEAEEVPDEMDPSIFGNIYHKIMEALYQPWIQQNKAPGPDDFKAMKDKIPALFEKIYQSEYQDLSLQDIRGRDFIAKEVIIKLVRQSLKIDQEAPPDEILDLEMKLTRIPFPLRLKNGLETQVYLKGYIDRVDKKDGAVRLLDYKTGKDEMVARSIEGLFEFSSKKSKKAIFQLFFYALLYTRKHGDALPIQPGLIKTQAMFSPDFSTQVMVGEHLVADARSYLDDYSHQLKILLEDILDPDKPFMQTENTVLCTYCSFASICRRP